MDIVYIETTVVGNIAGRIHPNPDVASRQRITREWWTTATSRYRIVTSRLTLDECGDGDPSAASERLEILQGIPLLNESEEAGEDNGSGVFFGKDSRPVFFRDCRMRVLRPKPLKSGLKRTWKTCPSTSKNFWNMKSRAAIPSATGVTKR